MTSTLNLFNHSNINDSINIINNTELPLNNSLFTFYNPSFNTQTDSFNLPFFGENSYSDLINLSDEIGNVEIFAWLRRHQAKPLFSRAPIRVYFRTCTSWCGWFWNGFVVGILHGRIHNYYARKSITEFRAILHGHQAAKTMSYDNGPTRKTRIGKHRANFPRPNFWQIFMPRSAIAHSRQVNGDYLINIGKKWCDETPPVGMGPAAMNE